MFLCTVTIAVGLAGARHYIARSSFGFETNMTLTILLIGMFCVRLLIGDYHDVDWLGLHSGVLLGLGVLAFSAVMLPVCILMDSAMVLGVGVVVFFGGLLSNYLVKTLVTHDFLSQAVRALTPNWQVYWVSDRLAGGNSVPIGYFGTCAVHALGFFVVFSILASMIVDRMEVPE